MVVGELSDGWLISVMLLSEADCGGDVVVAEERMEAVG